MSADHDEHQRLAMAARLREAREYLGFSQDEVAVSLGVSRPAITNIEAGSRKVEALEMQKLANLYGRSVSFLLTGAEEQMVEAEKVADGVGVFEAIEAAGASIISTRSVCSRAAR